MTLEAHPNRTISHDDAGKEWFKEVGLEGEALEKHEEAFNEAWTTGEL